MTHQLLFVVVCAAVCGAACSSTNTSKHCYIETDSQCIDIVIAEPDAADAGASLSIADASADASAGGAP